MSLLEIKQLPLALKMRQGKTFTNFISAENNIVVALLEALVTGAADQIYLHGEAGVGKSHLLEATMVLAEERRQRAYLLTGDTLLQFSPKLLEGLEDFALLALDDVELLAGCSEWEEALFHLYNRTREKGGKLLFAGKATPRQAGFMLPDLSTRLGVGPVLQVRPLDDLTLEALVRQRASARGLEVGESVARYLVMHAPRQPVLLESLIDQLDQAALAGGKRLTIPFVKQQMGW